MHALALKDKEEEHAGLLHTAGEIQVRFTCSKISPDAPYLINEVKSEEASCYLEQTNQNTKSKSLLPVLFAGNARQPRRHWAWTAR